MAQASVADCDGDGDPEDALDPLECGGNLQKSEPGKLYSKGEKRKFEESALELRRELNKICGNTGAGHATRLALLTMVALLAIGFVSNLLIKPVDERFHEPDDASTRKEGVPA